MRIYAGHVLMSFDSYDVINIAEMTALFSALASGTTEIQVTQLFTERRASWLWRR